MTLFEKNSFPKILFILLLVFSTNIALSQESDGGEPGTGGAGNGDGSNLLEIICSSWCGFNDTYRADFYLWSASIRASNLEALRAMSAQLRESLRGVSENKDGSGLGSDGLQCANPVMVATGNKIQFETDYAGKGEFPLNIQRVYNRAWSGTSYFGKKWIANYGHNIKFVHSDASSVCTINVADPVYPPPEVCEESGDSSKTALKIIANRPDGKKLVFSKDANGNWIDYKDDTINHFAHNADGSWTFTNESLFEETYNAQGLIIKRKNPEGIEHFFHLFWWQVN